MVKEIGRRSRRAAAFPASAIGIELPVALVGIFSCTVGNIYALKTDEQFDEQYVYEGRAFQ